MSTDLKFRADRFPGVVDNVTQTDLVVNSAILDSDISQKEYSTENGERIVKLTPIAQNRSKFVNVDTFRLTDEEAKKLSDEQGSIGLEVLLMYQYRRSEMNLPETKAPLPSVPEDLSDEELKRPQDVAQAAPSTDGTTPSTSVPVNVNLLTSFLLRNAKMPQNFELRRVDNDRDVGVFSTETFRPFSYIGTFQGVIRRDDRLVKRSARSHNVEDFDGKTVGFNDADNLFYSNFTSLIRPSSDQSVANVMVVRTPFQTTYMTSARVRKGDELFYFSPAPETPASTTPSTETAPSTPTPTPAPAATTPVITTSQ